VERSRTARILEKHGIDGPPMKEGDFVPLRASRIVKPLWLWVIPVQPQFPATLA